MRSPAPSAWPTTACDHEAAEAAFTSTVFWIAVTLARPPGAAWAESVAATQENTDATNAFAHTSRMTDRFDTPIASPEGAPRPPTHLAVMATCPAAAVYLSTNPVT